jgi:hypothetical protein
VTALGLIVTAVALWLVLARELAHVGTDEPSPARDRAVLVACAAWAVVTAVQIVRYLA